MKQGVDLDRFLKRGEEALSVFFENEAKDWDKEVLSELSIKGVKISNILTINGKIDMVIPKPNGSIVYDFKTGKPKSRGAVEGTTKSSDGSYKRQLLFYKLLLDQYQRGKFNMKEGVISFVEPDDKGRYHKETFPVEESETNELIAQIKQVSEEIYNLTFWDQFCHDPNCQYCALRKFMPF